MAGKVSSLARPWPAPSRLSSILFLALSCLLPTPEAAILPPPHQIFARPLAISTAAVTVTVTAYASPKGVTSVMSPTETSTCAATSQKSTTVVTAATTTQAPDPASTYSCDIRYCRDGTQFCEYWAGITGWDVSEGPIPGETITALGPCESSGKGKETRGVWS